MFPGDAMPTIAAEGLTFHVDAELRGLWIRKSLSERCGVHCPAECETPAIVIDAQCGSLVRVTDCMVSS